MSIISMSLRALMLFVIWAHPAYAVLLDTPEYFNAVEADLGDRLRPQILDSEFASDTLVYSTRLEHTHYLWRNSGNYLLSLGSISGKLFGIDQRMRVGGDLSPTVSAQMLYVEQGDFETDFKSMALELRYRALKNFQLLMWGAPSRDKAEDDLGWGVQWWEDQATYWRAFLNMPDITRNRRNLGEDEFSKIPRQMGGLRRHLSANKFHQMYLTRDQEWQWRRPQSDQHFGHEAWRTGLDWYNADSKWLYELRLHAVYEQYQDILASTDFAKTSVTFLWRGARTWWTAGEWSWWPEFLWESRYWDVAGRDRHQDWVIPMLWLSSTRTNWSVGVDSTFYFSQGEAADRFEPDKNFTSEQRLNLRYDFEFDIAVLSVMFTFDLDSGSLYDTFEGGNGRFVSSR